MAVKLEKAQYESTNQSRVAVFSCAFLFSLSFFLLSFPFLSILFFINLHPLIYIYIYPICTMIQPFSFSFHRLPCRPRPPSLPPSLLPSLLFAGTRGWWRKEDTRWTTARSTRRANLGREGGREGGRKGRREGGREGRSDVYKEYVNSLLIFRWSHPPSFPPSLPFASELTKRQAPDPGAETLPLLHPLLLPPLPPSLPLTKRGKGACFATREECTVEVIEGRQAGREGGREGGRERRGVSSQNMSTCRPFRPPSFPPSVPPSLPSGTR